MKASILALHLAHKIAADSVCQCGGCESGLALLIEREAVIPAKLEALQWTTEILNSHGVPFEVQQEIEDEIEELKGGL